MSWQHFVTSNGKQFTVTREMLTAVASDRRWPDVVAGISARFSKFSFFFFFCNNKSLNDWSLGEQRILFPSNLNVSLDFVSGNSLYPSGPSVKCLLFRAQLTLSSLTWPVTRVFYYPAAFCRVQITPKRVQISRSICTPEDRLDRFVCC